MATVNLDVGGSGGATSVDQAAYGGDTLLNVNALNANTTLTITNTTNSADTLDLQQTIGVNGITESTINLDGANVKVANLVGVDAGSTFNYGLSNGAELAIDSGVLAVNIDKTINIDMGGDSSNTFTYTPPTLGLGSATFNISGMSKGDELQVEGATNVAYDEDTGVLTFTKSVLGAPIPVASFNAPGLNPADIIIDGGTISYACYLKGTHIAVPEGEVKVESLKAGDKVLTASGGVATVKWLGHRTLYRNRIPAKDAVRAFPIVFKKDAIAENVPHRDLTLSPGHHLSFNGTLVPAMALVNGETIVQQFDTKIFQYFHVELEEFDIMLAEGTPAESYVDTGNRKMFQNAREVALNPDFGPATGRPEIPGITVARKGPVVDAIRAQLQERAEAIQVSEVQTRAA